MAKLKNPIFSLDAVRRLGNALTFRRSRGQNIAEKTPIPTDAKSLAQLSWRHMYQKATALWHALSTAEKQSWESDATRHHMTGYAWFMSQALKPNPGLYLPLQGGTMAGDIDMDGHKIEDLPNPTLAQDADTLAARTAAISAHQATLNAHMSDLFTPTRIGQYLNPSLSYFDLPGFISANQLYVVPFFVPRKTTFDRIAIHITVAKVAKDARLGIYNDGVNLYPGSLLLDAGTVDLDAIGVQTIVINQQLTKGFYWLAIVAEDTPTIRSPYVLYSPMGKPGTSFQYDSQFWRVAHAFAPLPDPFTPGGTLFATARTLPGVFLRVASLD